MFLGSALLGHDGTQPEVMQRAAGLDQEAARQLGPEKISPIGDAVCRFGDEKPDVRRPAGNGMPTAHSR